MGTVFGTFSGAPGRKLVSAAGSGGCEYSVQLEQGRNSGTTTTTNLDKMAHQLAPAPSCSLDEIDLNALKVSASESRRGKISSR